LTTHCTAFYLALFGVAINTENLIFNWYLIASEALVVGLVNGTSNTKLTLPLLFVRKQIMSINIVQASRYLCQINNNSSKQSDTLQYFVGMTEVSFKKQQ